MRQLHYLQLEILKKLLFADHLAFSELRPNENIENNKLVFHIEQLLDWKIIEKSDGKYRLTLTGKEYTNRMDTDETKIKQQAKISVITCCYKKEAGKNWYLLYTRKKQPFYDHQGFNSGKIMLGEGVLETAKRELKEETNLEGKPEIFTIEHHRVYDTKTKNLLEDKFFFFTRIENPSGELRPNNEGLFEWVEESKVGEYLTKPFESVEKIYDIIDRLKAFNGALTFHEVEHWPDNF